MLSDRRGGRAGFARAVNVDLRRLRDFIERTPGIEQDGGHLDKLRHFRSSH